MISQDVLKDYLNVQKNYQNRLNANVLTGNDQPDIKLKDTMGLIICDHLNQQVLPMRAAELLVSAEIAYMPDAARPDIALLIEDPIAEGLFDGLTYLRKGTKGQIAWVMADIEMKNLHDLDQDIADELFRTDYDFHMPTNNTLDEVLYLPVDSIIAVAKK